MYFQFYCHDPLCFPYPSTGDNFVGFTAVRQSSQPVDSERCHNIVYSTTIVWKCDSKKIWNPSANNVDPYFIESVYDAIAEPCGVSTMCAGCYY